MASRKNPVDQSRPDGKPPDRTVEFHPKYSPDWQPVAPMTRERQLALIAEARAARLRADGCNPRQGEGDPRHN